MESTETNTKQDEIAEIVNEHNRETERIYDGTMRLIDESSLDPAEKKALKARFAQPGAIAVPTIIGIKKEYPATIAMAREIFGSRFIGPNKIVELFGQRASVIPVAENSTLPFSIIFLEELLKAAPSTLIYQPTMPGHIRFDEFASYCEGMSSKSGGVLLYAKQFNLSTGKVNKKTWFADKKYSEFHANTIIKPNVFRIATDAEIPGTAHKCFMDQVMTACDWIEQSFPQSITQIMKDALAEIRKDFKMLQTTQNKNSAEFVKEIVKYKFFTLFMETGLETMWRLVAYEQATGTKLLRNMYLRNNVVEPVLARLGLAGYWDSIGPSVGSNEARDSHSILGLGFSCTGL